ncbi:MAG TPA: aspartate-semialdehyde dehydrogenase [bacterium]|nr:aspartate-semialdehyde dehydrogenase [bacterium]
MKLFNVAVVGATGIVGQEFISLLEQRNFPINELYLYASEKSFGEYVEFKKKEINVIPLTLESIENKNIDIAFFSAGSIAAKEMAPVFSKKGALVIDNSSAFRMDDGVPLVVPEVNGSILKTSGSKIIANPNCSTIQLVPFLDIINQMFQIKSVFVSTYQSVSGAGKGGIEELKDQVAKLFSGQSTNPAVFPQRIAFNLIPQIGPFYPEGYCEEEVKMINETRKILSMNDLDIDVTTVRVPTFFSHAETVVIETENDCDINSVRKRLNDHPDIILMDDPEELLYPTLIDCSGKNEGFIGRLRMSKDNNKRISAWIVADNVRKGAAYNAIRIAETVIGGFDE